MSNPEKSPSKYLVVGASGQVGTLMLDALAGRYGVEKLIPSSRTARPGWLRLDLSQLVRLGQADEMLGCYPLDAIFCVGGMTNVDACEDSPEVAFAANASGPGVLAAYARKRAARFVYFSTEYVFDGSVEHGGPYLETDVPRPLNVYGRSKLDGEHAVLDANPDALVVRTTVVYGLDPREKNYLYTLMRNLALGVTMRVPEDQISTPTYNRDLVGATFGLLESGASGIFHVCGPQRMDRLTFARTIASALQLDASLLAGVSTAALGQRATRPLGAGLLSDKLIRHSPHFKMHTLEEALGDCGAELRSYLERYRAVSLHQGTH